MISEPAKVLDILLIEDDRENLDLMLETLPKELSGFTIRWEPVDTFELGLEKLNNRRFDIVVTDVYMNRTGVKKGIDPSDERAQDVVALIRERRFCPVVTFTDGSVPSTFKKGPFVRFASKSRGDGEIIAAIQDVIATGVPWLARKLHEELDKAAGSYLWTLLDERWDDLNLSPELLERLARRRIAVQLGRLFSGSDAAVELETVEGLEYYLYPPISGDFRLGDLLRSEEDGSFRVITTPHCYLTVQPGADNPRADYMLTVKALPTDRVLEDYRWENTEEKRNKQLRRITQSPAQIGKPAGRYWFLPGFLDIPDLYCDLLQMESIPYECIEKHKRVATLDTPFAEALQARVTIFYATVGLPGLNVGNLTHLVRTEKNH